jgi:predicted small integral membrane protein
MAPGTDRSDCRENSRRDQPRVRSARGWATLLGSAFLFLAWLGIFGVPLWGGLVLALIWGFVVFRWV